MAAMRERQGRLEAIIAQGSLLFQLKDGHDGHGGEEGRIGPLKAGHIV